MKEEIIILSIDEGIISRVILDGINKFFKIFIGISITSKHKLVADESMGRIEEEIVKDFELLFEDVDMVISSLLARSFDLVKDSVEEFIGDSVLSLLVEMESFFMFINEFQLFIFGSFFFGFVNIGSFRIDSLSTRMSTSSFRTRDLREGSDEFGESVSLNYSSEKHTAFIKRYLVKSKVFYYP